MTPKRKLELLFMFLLLLFCGFYFMLAGICHAQERKTYTIPFHTVRAMILLDGQINGQPAVFLLDTGANNSIVDYRAAGFISFKLVPLRSTGSTGAEGGCIMRDVKLSLEHRSWFGRKVCIMDLSDISRRMETRIDSFVGQDILSEFSAVRIDYKAHTVTLED
jgi:hypothetical protein